MFRRIGSVAVAAAVGVVGVTPLTPLLRMSHGRFLLGVNVMFMFAGASSGGQCSSAGRVRHHSHQLLLPAAGSWGLRCIG
jgi:hypothetical protein